VAEDRIMFKELWERIMSTEPCFQQAVFNLRTFQLQDFPLADMNEKRLRKAKEFSEDAIREKTCVWEHQATLMLEEDITRELLLYYEAYDTRERSSAVNLCLLISEKSAQTGVLESI